MKRKLNENKDIVGDDGFVFLQVGINRYVATNESIAEYISKKVNSEIELYHDSGKYKSKYYFLKEIFTEDGGYVKMRVSDHDIMSRRVGLGAKGGADIDWSTPIYKDEKNDVLDEYDKEELDEWIDDWILNSIEDGLYHREKTYKKGGEVYNAHILTDDNKMIHRRYPKKVTHNEIYNEYKNKGVEIKDSQIHYAKPIDFYDTLREETKKYVIENMNDDVDSKSIFISSMQKGNEYIATEIKGDTISGKAFTITPKDLFEITMKNNTKRNYAKGGKVKKFPIAVQRRVDEINAMLPKVLVANDYPSTYAGSTMESYVVLKKPIEIKNQYVYINADKMRDNYPFEKRYNVNDREDNYMSSNGRQALMYDLGIIKKAFTKLLKNDSSYAKGGEIKEEKISEYETHFKFNVRDVDKTFYHNLIGFIDKFDDDEFVAFYGNELYMDSSGDGETKTFKTFQKAKNWILSKMNSDIKEYSKNNSKTYAEGGELSFGWAKKYLDDKNIYKKLDWYVMMGKGIEKQIDNTNYVLFNDGSALKYNDVDYEWEIASPKRFDTKGNAIFKKGGSTYEKVGEITEVNEDGSNLPKPLYDLFMEMDLDRLGDYSYMEELRQEANEIGYGFDYDLSGQVTEFWEINKMAKGGSLESHALAIGDEILGFDMGEALVINKGVVYMVDLANGKRKITKMTREDAISTFAKGGMTNNFDSDFMDLVKG